jgi:hypothetical protein
MKTDIVLVFRDMDAIDLIIGDKRLHPGIRFA